MKRIYLGPHDTRKLESRDWTCPIALQCEYQKWGGCTEYVNMADVQPLIEALERATAKAHSEGQGTAYWDAVLETFKANKHVRS